MVQSASLQNNSAASSIQVSGFSRLLDPQQYPNNLPLQLTSFIGRESDISAIKQRLWTTRLLTLTGPGGCGKTRLALRVATDLLDAFADGVWWIELAALTDPTLIAQTLATALGLQADTGRPIDDVLIDYLRSRQLLLILDNCEHLIEAGAQLTQSLLQACPDLYILATSREVLRIGGEVPYMVPPLATPHLNQLPGVEVLAHYEAVKLFAERAANALPGFEVTERNAAAIAQVCYRLDGMPLAIELAAARVKLLPIDQIVARLDDRFRLLTSGSRTALLRHQTLRATIDWSYDLLGEDERCVLCRLSVFVGGWTLEAAEAVCADREPAESAHIAPAQVLDHLSQLVNKSLVSAERAPGQETRYRMLETIRQYASEKLTDSSEAHTIRNRHLDYFVEWVERAEPELHRPQQLDWLNRLEADYDNLRAAVAWAEACHQAGDADEERGLRLVGALLHYWHARGHLSEARRWANTALAGTSSRTLARAHALRVAGWLAWRVYDSTTARAKLEESAAIYQEWGEAGRWGLAETLNCLGLDAGRRGDSISAQKYFEESLDLWRVVGSAWGIARSLNNLGSGATLRGDYDAARVLLAEGLATARAAGDAGIVSLLLWTYGENLAAQSDDTLARAHWTEGLRICRKLGDIWRSTGLIRSVAELEARSGETTKLEQAARLWGTAEALLTARGDAGPDNESTDRDIAAARAQLGEARFEAAWAEGAALTLNEAIDYALAVLEASLAGDQSAISSTARQATKQRFGGLTAREREVAALIAQGQSNRHIAETLVLSERTIEGHVSNIFNKLGFNARTQIAAWTVEKGLVKTA